MIGGVLGMGRRMAEARMTDKCEITRAGTPVWDEEAGENIGPVEVVYQGPCRVKHPSTAARDVEAGSQLLAVTFTELHLPLSAVGVRADDAATILESSTRLEQAARQFTIMAPFDGSQTTALRFRVEAFDER